MGKSKLSTATTALSALLAAAPSAWAQEQAAAQEPPGFWHRDTLTGDWGGLRTALADQGVTISASYTAEVFANVQGGMKRGSEDRRGVYPPGRRRSRQTDRLAWCELPRIDDPRSRTFPVAALGRQLDGRLQHNRGAAGDAAV